jgi:hypothetical protein
MRLGLNGRHEQERFMRIRKYAAATAAAAGLLAIAIPAAGASAATMPAASGPPSFQPPAFTFVPPRVGQISVDIAPTIINGQVVDPGLHVATPGTSLAPITWTLPALK